MRDNTVSVLLFFVLRRETGHSRESKSADMSTLTGGGRGPVFICVCVRACLGKNAKKNLHLEQPSSILSLSAAEDESHCIKLD